MEQLTRRALAPEGSRPQSNEQCIKEPEGCIPNTAPSAGGSAAGAQVASSI